MTLTSAEGEYSAERPVGARAPFGRQPVNELRESIPLAALLPQLRPGCAPSPRPPRPMSSRPGRRTDRSTGNGARRQYGRIEGHRRASVRVRCAGVRRTGRVNCSRRRWRRGTPPPANRLARGRLRTGCDVRGADRCASRTVRHDPVSVPDRRAVPVDVPHPRGALARRRTPLPRTVRAPAHARRPRTGPGSAPGRVPRGGLHGDLCDAPARSARRPGRGRSRRAPASPLRPSRPRVSGIRPSGWPGRGGRRTSRRGAGRRFRHTRGPQAAPPADRSAGRASPRCSRRVLPG